MTWTIHIKGRVQGVGFRPFVWRAALDRQLKGWVANGLEGVLIKVNGSEEQIVDFQNYILKNPPQTAYVESSSLTTSAEHSFFDNFTIKDSNHDGLPVLHLTPDVALCNNCREDILAPENRRYHYPFTTCTVCGPRYSILTGLPYDRPLTTMQGFVMCAACQQEYGDPANRRYYAQTNSCPHCGIVLRLFRSEKGKGRIMAEPAQILQQASTLETEIMDGQAGLLKQVIEAWQKGAIIAIKGIGGFLLTCDAGNAATVATLRARKHRPSKPFALMYPDLDTLWGDALVPETARQHLQSPAAPIVLLEQLEQPRSGLATGIAPGLHKIGAMLPNAPLFEVLLRDFGKPIVATSGNVSNTPLVFEDEKAIQQLPEIADYILTHNRPIVMPQDDSVITTCKMETKAASVVLRRARGLAPAWLQPDLQVPETAALALGADLKSTFTLVQHGIVNVSQYLGDLTDFEAQTRFQQVLGQLTGLYQAQPAVVIGDLHPGYFTTTFGQTLAQEWQLPWVQVQHHHAHFSAVLAENGLFAPEAPVLGVVWDGTGFGNDGQIWGGEFFLYTGQNQTAPGERFQRCAHFDYFPLLLGDKMPREPRLSALSACWGVAAAVPWLRPKFTETEWKLYQKLPAQTNLLKTSSVGRIFDAVAALLGLADKISYEGEAALLLEDLASTYCNRHGFDFPGIRLEISLLPGQPLRLHTADFFRQLIGCLDAGHDKACLAAKCHFALVEAIGRIARLLNIQKIAFSGGVFQNTLLLEMAQYLLSPNHTLYFHRQLSPNDESISFGQWAYVEWGKF